MSYLKSDEYIIICSKFQKPYQFSFEELNIDISNLKTAVGNISNFYELSMINFLIGFLYGELAQQQAFQSAIWNWTQPEIEQETFHFWTSLYNLEKLETLDQTNLIHKTSLLTNIGNLFSNVGRSSSAQLFL